MCNAICRAEHLNWHFNMHIKNKEKIYNSPTPRRNIVNQTWKNQPLASYAMEQFIPTWDVQSFGNASNFAQVQVNRERWTSCTQFSRYCRQMPFSFHKMSCASFAMRAKLGCKQWGTPRTTPSNDKQLTYRVNNYRVPTSPLCGDKSNVERENFCKVSSTLSWIIEARHVEMDWHSTCFSTIPIIWANWTFLFLDHRLKYTQSREIPRHYEWGGLEGAKWPVFWSVHFPRPKKM